MKKAFPILVAALILILTQFAASANPDASLLRAAKSAFASKKGQLNNQRYITIIDYRKNIFQTRLWVYDSHTDQIVLASRVSHAWESGMLYASSVSNQSGSNKSCIGTFITMGTYSGKFGYSLRIKGVSANLNTNALSRTIIFHTGLTYSNGCFMTDSKTNKRLINLIKGGSLVYVSK